VEIVRYVSRLAGLTLIHVYNMSYLDDSCVLTRCGRTASWQAENIFAFLRSGHPLFVYDVCGTGSHKVHLVAEKFSSGALESIRVANEHLATSDEDQKLRRKVKLGGSNRQVCTYLVRQCKWIHHDTEISRAVNLFRGAIPHTIPYHQIAHLFSLAQHFIVGFL